MKKITLKILSYIAIIYLLDSLILGFDFVNASAVILFAAVFTITDYAIKPIIKFLTIPVNFLTFGLFNFMLFCLYLYCLNFLIRGFKIIDGSIGSITNAQIVVPTIKLSVIGVVVVTAVIMSVLNSIAEWAID